MSSRSPSASSRRWARSACSRRSVVAPLLPRLDRSRRSSSRCSRRVGVFTHRVRRASIAGAGVSRVRPAATRWIARATSARRDPRRLAQLPLRRPRRGASGDRRAAARSRCGRARLGRWPPSSRSISGRVERQYWLLLAARLGDLRQRSGDRLPEARAEPGRVLAAAAQRRRRRRSAIRIYDGRRGLMVHRHPLRARLPRQRDRTLPAAREPETADGDYGNLVNPAFWRLRERSLPVHERGARRHRQLKLLVGPVKNVGWLHRLPVSAPGRQPVRLGRAGDRRRRGDEATLGTVLDPRFDPLRVAVFDSVGAGQRRTDHRRSRSRSAITANVTRYDPGQIDVELERAGAGRLGARRLGELLSRLDGRPSTGRRRSPRSAPTTPSSACRLPAGATKVELDFQRPRLRDRASWSPSWRSLARAAGAGDGRIGERSRRVV